MIQKSFTPKIFILFLFLMSVFSVKATIIPVTIGTDTGIGSLREVVIAANSGDTISFTALLNGLPILITNEIAIDKSLTIMGNGTTNTIINANASARIFAISNNANVAIIAVAMIGGQTSESGGAVHISGDATVVIDNCLLNGNSANGDAANQGGGGIYNGATLTLQNGTIVSNNAATGASGSGGGIFNDTGASLTITDCTISGNTCSRAGGGIEDASGNATIAVLTNVSITGNSTSAAPGNGGGVHITGAGNMTITGGSVSENIAAAEGGGLWNGAGSMTVSGVTIDANSATGNEADQGGGGIYNLSGSLTIDNKTMITNNTCNGTSGSGGGILNDVGASLTINDCTISGNSASRAGGGIEDVSGDGTTVILTNVTAFQNSTGSSPGNGGAVHITGAGNMMITGGEYYSNTAVNQGGALWNGAGTMNVNNVAIHTNEAFGGDVGTGGGGIYNKSGNLIVENNTTIRTNICQGPSASGGGIYNADGATLTISDCSIDANYCKRAGGGIEDASGSSTTTVLTNVNLNGNSADGGPGNGGAIHITGAGNMQITGGKMEGNVATAEGGALWNGAGTMTVSGVQIEGNAANGNDANQGGGGIYNLSGTLIIDNQTMIINNACGGTSGSGGGILNDVNASLTINDCTISGNRASRAGGGIEDVSGSATTVALTNVTIANNITGSAPGNGGGVHITGDGNMTILGGFVSGNTAEREGGGLWNGAGLMTVTAVTVDANIAKGAATDDGGGGIFNNGGTINIIASLIAKNEVSAAGSRSRMEGNGGGIHNLSGGTINLNNATISGNTSISAGGGIYNAGNLNVITSTIANNVAASGGGLAQTVDNSTATVSSSIVAANTATIGQDLYITAGAATSLGYNLIGVNDANAFVALATDIAGSATTAINAMLTGLANNGGNVQTHAIVCGSPAINTGDPAIIGNDARGMAVFGGQRDMGAYELQEACMDATPLIPTINVVNPQFGSDLIITAKLSGANEVPAVTTDAVGVATIHFNEDRTAATINATVSNLSSAFTGAHIHIGKPGENGGVLIPLSDDYVNGRLTATFIDIDNTLLSQFINGELYLNIHTENNPAGELRGNLKLEAPESFAGLFTADQEVPEVDAQGTGLVTVHYTANTNVLEINALVEGLTGPITGAHFHNAPEGENGGVVGALTEMFVGNALKVKIQAGDYIEALRAGNIYLNIHTAANPSGEIRAQIEVLEGVVVDSWLTADQEVHEVTGSEAALGLAVFGVNGSLDTLNYLVQMANLSGSATAAHLHAGALGTAGGVVLNMSDDIFDKLIANIDIPVDASIVNSILSGDIYLNVHTEANPMGEIRGQLYRLAREGYTYDICSEQEIPAPTEASEVSGSGMFAFNRDMDEAHLMVTVNQLTAAFTGAHIHTAAAGETGGVILPFTDNWANGGAFLYFTGESDRPINADFAEIIRNGNAYVNIHTENNPAGEVRGQIVKTLDCPLLISATIEVGQELVTFEVFPNPAMDNLTLAIPTVDSKILSKLNLRISNNIGQVVKHISGVTTNQQININDLTPGMYYLSLTADGAVSSVKFIKE